MKNFGWNIKIYRNGGYQLSPNSDDYKIWKKLSLLDYTTNKIKIAYTLAVKVN